MKITESELFEQLGRTTAENAILRRENQKLMELLKEKEEVEKK